MKDAAIGILTITLTLFWTSARAESQSRAELRATTESVSMNGGLADCPADTMRLKLLEGGKEVLVRDYCSAYGQGGARLLSDKRARHYVVLDYSEGKGTRNTSKYVQVYELVEGALFERARLLRSTPIGRWADLVFDYSVETPGVGGLKIAGRSRIDGRLEAGEVAPSQQRTVLTIH